MMNASTDENQENKTLCGTISITDSGCLIYECSLCTNEYGFHNDYWMHVMKEHFLSRPDVNFSAEDLKEIANDDDYDCAVEAISVKQEAEEFFEETPASQEDEPENSQADFTQAVPDGMVKPIIKVETLPPEKVDTPVSANNTSQPVKTLDKAAKLVRQALLKHATNVKCPKCGKILKNMARLRVHLKRHLQIRRFKCDLCENSYIDRSELNLHMRRHNNERPFLCFECGNSFYSSGALTEHRKRRHNEARNYPCTECSWKFKTKSLLTRHMVIHTKERNFLCSLCDARFPRRTSLVCHMKIHENKREYTCSLCGAGFNQKAGLHSHMKSKHKVGEEMQDD